MPLPDLLRLLAVPVFAWAAWQDVETRRVSDWAWYPLLALGMILIVWDVLALPPDPNSQFYFLLRVALSIGLLGGLGYGFHYLGLVGRADAKAFLTLGVLFPVYPMYQIGEITFPLFPAQIRILSLSALTNGALLGIAFPVFLFAWNVARGRFSPRGFLYYTISVDSLPTSVGSIYVGTPPSGPLLSRLKYYVSMLNAQKDRLDLDALRMYLRWRGIALEDVRAYPEEIRRPTTLPAEPNPPTDGVVDPELDPDPVGGIPPATFGGRDDDPWGAETFLEDVGGAYGTTPNRLRAGLDQVATNEKVWITPGLPMLVPVFVGLVVALVFGDLLSAVLGLLGLA